MNIVGTKRPRPNSKNQPATAIKPKIEAAIARTREEATHFGGNSLGDLKVYPDIYNQHAQERQMLSDLKAFETARKSLNNEDATVYDVISELNKQKQIAEREAEVARAADRSFSIKSKAAVAGAIALAAGGIATMSLTQLPGIVGGAVFASGLVGIVASGAYQNDASTRIIAGQKQDRVEYFADSHANAHMWANFGPG